MNWRVEFRPTAAKELRKLDRQVQVRILSLLHDRVAILDNPRSLATPLSGSMARYSRFRVGDYRIIAEFQDERLIVLVMKIGNRREVYRR